MNDGQPEFSRFNSPEELIEFVRTKSDDIESVTISIAEGVLMSNPWARDVLFRGIAGCIHKISGETLMLERDQLELLLNDGLLSRLRLSIRLLPLKAD